MWTMLRSVAVLEPGIRMISPKRVARITRAALDIPGLEPVRTSAATGRRVQKLGWDRDDNGGGEDAAKEHWPLIATRQSDIATHADTLLTWSDCSRLITTEALKGITLVEL